MTRARYLLDINIASFIIKGKTPLAPGAVLVTNDSAFARIADLKVVDWTK